MAFRLPRLPRGVQLVDSAGNGTVNLRQWWQSLVEAIEAAPVGLVAQNSGPAWTDATGTAARTALASYAGQVVSNPPTQAEVQAIDDAVKAHSQALVALINDLKANGALT